MENSSEQEAPQPPKFENLSKAEAAELAQNFMANRPHNWSWGVVSAEATQLQEWPPVYGARIVIKKVMSREKILTFFPENLRSNVQIVHAEDPPARTGPQLPGTH